MKRFPDVIKPERRHNSTWKGQIKPQHRGRAVQRESKEPFTNSLSLCAVVSSGVFHVLLCRLSGSMTPGLAGNVGRTMDAYMEKHDIN